MNHLISCIDNNDHMHGVFGKMPFCLAKMLFSRAIPEFLPKKFHTEEYARVAGHYYALMSQRMGMIEVVQLRMCKFFDWMYNPLFTSERMLQDFDFPIAFVNGSRDFFGSAEGSNRIVENNRFFKSGESQVFKLKNCGHNAFLEQPDELVTIMTGFFTGTIKHTFDLKPRKEFVPDSE